VSAAATPYVTVFHQSGGSLRGTGTITVTSVLNWSAGTMTDAGFTIVDAGATLDINGSAEKRLYIDRTLRNDGTGIWTGDGKVYMYSNATFHNTSSFDMQSDAPWESAFGGLIANDGTVTYSLDGVNFVDVDFQDWGNLYGAGDADKLNSAIKL